MEWYCVIRGERRGPMAWDDLRRLAETGELLPADLVWQPQFGDTWRDAGHLAGLMSFTAAAAPTPEPAEVMVEEPAAPPVVPATTPLTGETGERPSGLEAGRCAWRRMKGMLFSPFDLARWFSIGFCAWLATFGGGGGCSGQFDPKVLKRSVQGGESPLAAIKEQVRTFLVDHPALTAGLLAAIAVGVLMALALGILFCWLRARGTFMLLHRLHRPAATIRESWDEARVLAPSLFWWRMALGLSAAVTLLVLAGCALVSTGLPMLRLGTLDPAALPVLLLWVCLLALVAMVWISLSTLTRHFIEPVMYWRKVGVLQAWRVISELCAQYPGAVFGYFMWLAWWGLLAGLAILMVIPLTCCIAAVLLFIPFVGAVTLLPVTLFFRAAGMEFVRQWRPDLLPRGLDQAGD